MTCDWTVRSATRCDPHIAEIAELARRRLKRGQFVLPGQPSKMSPINGSRRGKRSRVRFAAGSAGAVIDWPGETVDLVADGTTKATSEHVNVLQKEAKGKEPAARLLSGRSKQTPRFRICPPPPILGAHSKTIRERPVRAHLPLALQSPDSQPEPDNPPYHSRCEFLWSIGLAHGVGRPASWRSAS